MVEEKIQQLFSKYSNSIYRFTSISYSLYANEYKSALVFAVPHGEQLTIKIIQKKGSKKESRTQNKYATKKEVFILKSMEEKMPVVFVWLPVRLECRMLSVSKLLPQ